MADCEITGCGKLSGKSSKRFCDSHYRKLMRSGSIGRVLNPPTQVQKIAIIASYEEGNSTYKIGAGVGMRPGKVGYWLNKWGVALRPVGFQRGQKSPRYRGDPDHKRKSSALWRRANPDKVRQSKRKQMLRLEVRLATALRTGLNRGIRRNAKCGSAVKDLGCSITFFIQYIKSRFVAGMSWDNWGEWHLDHIRPLASFDLTDREQFLSACHYTNIQPLWASDNLAKRAKRITPQPLSLIRRSRKKRQEPEDEGAQMPLL